MFCRGREVGGGGPPSKIFVCIITTEIAPPLRSLQGLVAMQPALFDLWWAARSNPPAQAFPTPALRTGREGRGTRRVGDALEINNLGHPPAEDEQASTAPTLS